VFSEARNALYPLVLIAKCKARQARLFWLCCERDVTIPDGDHRVGALMMSGPRPRPGIMDISPYVGGRAKLEGESNPIRLASNENPFGASPKAMEAFRQAASHLNRYPDGGSTALTQAIARQFAFDPQQIVCGNGSDELIGNLVRAYAGPGDEVLYSAHGFLMYPIAARSVGALPVAAPETNLTTDIAALLAHVSDRTRLVFIANPNNPTGSFLKRADLLRLREALPEQILLVIDAAYAEYVAEEDYEDGAWLVSRFDNVVMTRTFSKIYGLAALGLGWAYCSAPVADVLHRLRMPFNVNLPAQAAGVAALEDQDHVIRARQHNTVCLKRFREGVCALGLEAPKSVGNFQLVQFPSQETHNAAAAYSYLSYKGIITRGMSGYGLPESLRISIGREEDMETVLQALTSFLRD